MRVLFYKDMAYSNTVNLYRVRDLYPPRNQNLNCPPAVNPLKERPLDAASTVFTKMCSYGWDSYLRELNGDKFESAVGPAYAMFNHPIEYSDQPFCERDGMESLVFDRAWVLAVPDIFGWMRVLTLPYTAGPPKERPSYEQNPLYVQKLTYQCRSGNMFSRKRYYPMTCSVPVYIESSRLEPWNSQMETLPPPIGSELIGNFLEEIAEVVK